MVSGVGAALAAILGARVLVGWLIRGRWDPKGDPDLVAAVTATRTRFPARTACVVIDRSTGVEQVRQAFNRCDEHTVFELGSVTKALTGLLLADAVARGEVDTGTRLDQVWPELAGRPAGPVTLDELAHHRSGLPASPLGPTAGLRLLLHAYLGLDPYRGLRRPALLRIAARARRRGAGTERYSNLGAALAGQTVARRADRTYPELLAERITGPLGMTSTSGDPRAARRSGRTRLGSWAQPWRLDGYGPAGGVTSTPADMTRLLRALLDGSVPGSSALETGLFWQVHTTAQGRRRIWHNGETGGYSAYLAVYPEAAKAVVVLSARADAEAAGRLAGACIAALSS